MKMRLAPSAAAGSATGTGDVRLEKLLYAIQLGQGIGSLKFVPSLEAEFRQDHDDHVLSRQRTGFVVAIGLYLAFLTLRLLTETGAPAVWGLALRATIIAAMATTVLLSYTTMRRHMTAMVIATYAIFGMGVTAIECVAHHYGIDRRYEGLIFICVHCYVFGGLLFRQACGTTLFIVLSFAVGGWLGGLVGKQWGYEMFFLLLINILGAVALYMLEYADRENFLRRHIIREMAIRDGLTGLYNRTAFVEHFERVLRQATREAQPVAVMIFDLDHFKQYNDQYGHLAGDECLRSVSAAVAATANRPLDMLARYGGEEFIGVWFDVPSRALESLAESVRQSVADLNIEHLQSPRGHVTISVGALALTPMHGDSVGSLIKSADEALYEAKARGRDAVVVRVRDTAPRPVASAA